jgi:hypothetical protein
MTAYFAHWPKLNTQVEIGIEFGLIVFLPLMGIGSIYVLVKSPVCMLSAELLHP